ncbi:hypothetical protein M404DRAFT_1005755, partial [Pisolithus tinctorius Marx 270]
ATPASANHVRILYQQYICKNKRPAQAELNFSGYPAQSPKHIGIRRLLQGTALNFITSSRFAIVINSDGTPVRVKRYSVLDLVVLEDLGLDWVGALFGPCWRFPSWYTVMNFSPVHRFSFNRCCVFCVGRSTYHLSYPHSVVDYRINLRIVD